MYTVFFLHISYRPEESTRSHYRWLWATMWLLEIELRTFWRAGNALNLWAISPAPKLTLFKKILIYLLCIQYSVRAWRPEEGTRPHYRWLWAITWLLEIELRTFGRAGNALHLWAISPALENLEIFCIGSASSHPLSLELRQCGHATLHLSWALSFAACPLSLSAQLFIQVCLDQIWPPLFCFGFWDKVSL